MTNPWVYAEAVASTRLDGETIDVGPVTVGRPGDQPPPTRNDGPIIQELVIADMRERLALGIQRYGTGLQTGNGRDMLRDAYEEALDLAVYLRGCLAERDGVAA